MTVDVLTDDVELSDKEMFDKQKWTKTPVSGDTGEFRLTNLDNSNHLTAIATGIDTAGILTSKFNHYISQIITYRCQQKFLDTWPFQV